MRKTANILSFKYGSRYGEIILCPEEIRRDARQHRNRYKDQCMWMIAHGMLHLSGMHHEKSHEVEKRFTRLEEKILNKARFLGA